MQEFRSGLELKTARTLAGATQKQLAEEAGIHPKTLAYWEKRDRPDMHSRFKRSVTSVLAQRGVFFIPGPNIGVCLHKIDD